MPLYSYRFKSFKSLSGSEFKYQHNWSGVFVHSASSFLMSGSNGLFFSV